MYINSNSRKIKDCSGLVGAFENRGEKTNSNLNLDLVRTLAIPVKSHTIDNADLISGSVGTKPPVSYANLDG